MRPCSSCGNAIDKSTVFCGKCGAKIPPESLPTTPHVSVRVRDAVDPLASTAPASKSPAAELLRRAREASGEPASSGAKRRLTRGKTVPLSALQNPSLSSNAPANPSSFPVDHESAPAVSLAPGARVLVQWANGQKYPGVIERVSGPQCLVRFDVGEQRWVETRFVFTSLHGS